MPRVRVEIGIRSNRSALQELELAESLGVRVVTIDEGAADPGTLVDVRITDAGDYDLRGMIV